MITVDKIHCAGRPKLEFRVQTATISLYIFCTILHNETGILNRSSFRDKKMSNLSTLAKCTSVNGLFIGFYLTNHLP